MPPLKGIDRGLNGEALMALEESGHGRRLAIVDASYDIPREAQSVDYRGQTSAEALKGILALVPYEPGTMVVMVSPSEVTEGSAADRSHDAFQEALDELFPAEQYPNSEGMECSVLVPPKGWPGEGDGFYDLVNHEHTLFVRTPDRLPFACISFIIGHSQDT